MWVHEPDTFFFEAAREISEKWNFFVNPSVPENFQWEIFLGQAPTQSLYTQDSEYVYEWGVEDFFDQVLPARTACKLKRNPKNGIFRRQKSSSHFQGQTGDTRSTFGVPLKT